MEKKVKADAKRARRNVRKQDGGESTPQIVGHPDLDPSDYAEFLPSAKEPDPTEKADPAEPVDPADKTS